MASTSKLLLLIGITVTCLVGLLLLKYTLHLMPLIPDDGVVVDAAVDNEGVAVADELTGGMTVTGS